MPREAPPPLLSHGNGPRARPARRPSRPRKASPAPGGPSRRGQIRRTMRPRRGRPSCRAGDLAAGHKGAREPRASQAGGGNRGGSLRPRRGWGHPAAARGHVRLPLGAPKGPQRAAGAGGRPRKRGGRETKEGSAGSGGVRGGSRRRAGVRGTPRVGKSPAAAAGFAEVRPPSRRVRALSAVLAAGQPRGTERHGRGANCVPRATGPNRGRAGQLPWQRGRGGVGSEVTAKSILSLLGRGVGLSPR